jgi:tRNA A-37 threonylcarbamoyl transferase component Bud32
MPPPPGPETLGAGRFEVRGMLGAGGAGVVYRVFDRQLGRELALKLLRQASGRDLFRFKREFRTLAEIVHPNLIALHELHAAGGDWYFTMELVEGVSFIDWARPGKQSGPARTREDIIAAPLDEHRLRGALVQLVDALLALHKAGKLHRDLKPSNVLVTEGGRLALLDFGLVASVAEGDPDRLAVGTPVYMSPEQAADQTLGEASDWYSVGAMLYEAFTGRRPFEGTSHVVMTRKQTEQPVNPQKLVPDLPAALVALCTSLLAPRPAARPTGLQILDALDATPSPMTRAMTRSYPPTAFVGREAELAQLATAYRDARRAGVAVLVRGKSGIGKSTFVRRFVRSLGDTVFAIEGRCFERETVPFKMLDGVVDSLTAALVGIAPDDQAALAPRDLAALLRVFPVLRRVERFSDLASQTPVPVDPQELRRRGLRALKSLLAKLARVRPIVIFVDDAHWGDVDSAVVLADLAHGAEPGMLVIVAHRPEDYLGVIAQLRRVPGGHVGRGDLRELEIFPLTDHDAELLVAQLAPDRDAGDRTQIVVAAAAGNPLVLTEMARAHDVDPAAPQGGGINQLVRARVEKLAPEAQAMLAVSSVAARPLPVAIAAHAAGVVGGHDQGATLSTQRLATLRQVEGQMILHPAHDYVRTAVLAMLDVEARASWHEAIARAFEAVQGEAQLDSEAVVEHWLAAGHPANAAHHAVAAALKAEDALAFRRAAELYQIALSYGPWDATGQRDLLRRKAHALVCASQLDEAAQVYAHAAQLVSDEDAIDLERLRVETLLRRGRLDEALPACEKLLAQIGYRIPLGARASRTRMATQWVAAKLRGLEFVEREATTIPHAQLLGIDVLYSIASSLAFTDPALGRVVQSELVRASLDAGEPVRVALALAQEVCYAAAAGSRNRGAVEAVGTRLKALAIRVGHPEVIGFADVAIGIAAHMGGRWREARGHLESGLSRLRDEGSNVRWEVDLGETFWLATLFYLGEWRELVRMTQLLLRDAIDRGDVVAQQSLRSGRCNMSWLLAGKPEQARVELAIAERSLEETSPDGAFFLPHVACIVAAANIDLYTGDATSALQRLDDARARIERLGAARLQLPRIELATLRARALLARGGDEREVLAIADELIKEGAAWAAGLGHLVRAASYAFARQPEAARVELLAAEEQLVATGMMGHLQIARLRRGGIEGGAIGTARAAAARDFLKDLGAVDPDRVAMHLMPWPP